ncbi:MAG: hypothetical protein EG826_12945 [Deltaproteobacteria bacterium]|nr:hypothetical protein [Deltaproteobacteria bacterium]
MKRFLLVLLSLGLITALSTSAMAVDIKFSGEYYAAGLYLDKTTFKKGTASDGPSTAFYFQRLRLRTDFVVSPGLSLTTRADIMERAWGAARSVPGGALDTLSAGTRAENENIAFDLAYVTYLSPIGMFTAGYQIDQAFGTTFADNSQPVGKFAYFIKIEGFIATVHVGKDVGGENSRTAINPVSTTDRDNSFVTAAMIYQWKAGEVGLLGTYHDARADRTATLFGVLPFDNTVKFGVVIPYIKAKFGPFAVQAELNYLYGTVKWEAPGDATALAILGTDEIKLRQLAAYIDAVGDFGMFYAGGSLAYVSGDDPSTVDKSEGGIVSGGIDWNPCLIMFNNDLTYWAGNQIGHPATPTTNTANGGPMTNAYFAQLRAGVRPIDKLDIMGSVSYAVADKTPQATWVSRVYGYEVDLTATYKITNNLSYMLGGGYFFTGDYFKGASEANQINNNFMVINKLTLTF